MNNIDESIAIFTHIAFLFYVGIVLYAICAWARCERYQHKDHEHEMRLERAKHCGFPPEGDET